MRTITVRELQKRFKQTLALVEQGETLRVTLRRQVVAEIVPFLQPTKPWPSLAARAEGVLGKRTLKLSAAEQIISDRGR